MRQIGEHLNHPIRCGMFLSRAVIRKISEKSRTPAGFGSRRLMLNNLLDSAAHYRELPSVVDALRDEVNTWRTALANSPLDCGPWLDKLTTTDTLLLALRDGANRSDDDQ